ncbi:MULTISPECIES: DUF423 domain-containing protein [unclassified Vibrio]|uniref:DUF423 domain-containing protein n=1 Tax=Vibrio sp. HB236076 TaxID=3232307 RepID=A0AB39HI04_9VIBR|nr:DUF423 domain-containing protein [Vibrio sp. HB161653]MDP5254190.1 DUF423 domain-containing protein [Vibrio sp. HB161653]
MNNNKLYGLAACLCAVAVLLGAFGAHGLANVLNPQQLDAYQTGVHYHFIHSIGALLCGVFANQASSLNRQKGFFYAALCFIIGVFCFSGSLYALALTQQTWFGPITPLGGLMFVVGWLRFAWALWKS